MITILTDEEVGRVLSAAHAVKVVEQAFKARAEGAMVSPARFSVNAGEGGLVFTAGAETKYTHSIGFRVYDAYPSKQSGHHQQLVAVYDSQTGEFKGLVIGGLVGALRTAAINAVAIRHMAREDVATLGILGSGFQARNHLLAALAVRRFQEVKVYSPNAAHREAFVAEMNAAAVTPVKAVDSAEEVVRSADVLICATRSSVPVFEAAWVNPGAHVNTIGPKFAGSHELPIELAQRSRVIATDSLQQLNALQKPHFLAGSPDGERILELSEIVAGNQQGRLSAADVTLFCSVGLSGTEVVVADEALRLTERL